MVSAIKREAGHIAASTVAKGRGLAWLPALWGTQGRAEMLGLSVVYEGGAMCCCAKRSHELMCHGIDLDMQVERALLERDCRPALSWCDEHSSKLRKIESVLPFQVRQRVAVASASSSR